MRKMFTARLRVIDTVVLKCKVRCKALKKDGKAMM